MAAITLAGLVPRLIHFDGSLVGDELSTLWIVQDRSLGQVFHWVSSDAEISPPLYFVLSWVTTHLGSAADLVRLPSLIAGTAAIPLTYLVGRRAVGRLAGILAAAAMALNPFMVFYSTDGRAYAVAIALLLASTLSMLIAAQDGGRRWWVLYGAFTCLCMYAHYTTAFVLGAQLLWLLWAHPQARRPALLATAAAAVLFLPWLPSMIDDLHSPTVDVLNALQGDGFAVKRDATLIWAFGYPFNSLDEIPGYYVHWIGPIGLGLAAVVAAIYVARRRWPPASAEATSARRGLVLVLMLALATPVAEAVLLLVGGSDLYGARNLNTSSGGLALAIGAILAAIGPYWGTACAVAVLGSFAVGTAKSLSPDTSTINFESPAAYIDSTAGEGDVVVDGFAGLLTPVPLTALDVYLDQDHPEYRLGLAQGPPPFLKETSDVPSGNLLLRQAFRRARGNDLFLVSPGARLKVEKGVQPSLTYEPAPDRFVPEFLLRVPPGARVVDSVSFPGVSDTQVLRIAVDDRQRPADR